MYHLICMSFDGEFVIEGQFKTIAEAWERSDDMGSRWFFYPFHFVLSESKKSIVDSCELLKWANKKRISTIQKIFKKHSEKPEMKNADVEEFIYSI